MSETKLTRSKLVCPDHEWIFPRRLRGKFPMAILLCFFAVIFSDADLTAQQSAQLPNRSSYNQAVFAEFYRADYKDAERDFRRGYNTAYRLGDRRYLDSVCFLTMIGECHYHVGNYSQAIQSYEEALRLYLSHQAQSWQSRVNIPPSIQADQTAYTSARITWGTSNRGATAARVPTTFSVEFGARDSSRAFQEGGRVDNANIRQVNVTEIMRCAALCLHRRRAIKGPISKLDPFSSTLVSGLRVSGAGNGTIMGAYNGVLLGIAQASMEDYDRASKTLKSSLQIKRMDHALTPVALLELAQIGGATKHYAAAGEVAMEASYAAAAFDQFDLVEEALSEATKLHLVTSKTAFAPLEHAIPWAKRERASLMQASLIHRLAESLAEGGQADLATQVLRQANGVINNRNSLRSSVVSSRLKYIGALIEFLNGDLARGQSELRTALEGFQTGSRWLYQLSLADELASGGASQREADRVYEALLHDPSELDWKTDPMEAIAFLNSPHLDSVERWFDIVIDRKNPGRAIEVADLLRRHRFFASLPLGGRLLSLRWMMHAPEESLSKEAVAQKQKFLASHSSYAALVNQANQITTGLDLLPVNPAINSPEERKQSKLIQELATVSSQQESLLASFALRREPAEMSFPPPLRLKDFQSRIANDQVALVCVSTSAYHLFLLNSNSVQYLDPVDSKVMTRSVGGLLKKMGISDPALDVKTVQDTQWKTTAQEMKSGLFGSTPDESWPPLRELVIVPDGVLWYLPFEAIPLTGVDGVEYLSDAVNIRYSPTLGLGFGKQRTPAEIKNTAVVTGRMFSRGEAELSKLQFKDFVKTHPDAIQYQRSGKVPANYLVSLLDQLIVWSEIKSARNQPLTMNPFQFDTRKPGSTLESWIALPWRGAGNVIMPGINSDGGSGFRGKLYGHDLFLTSVGLMASGSRSALLSRWATGGKTAIELTKQYASELPKSGMAQAIFDSRKSVRESDLEYAQEPRVRAKRDDPVIKGAHPFFWAAHMLFSIPDGAPVPAAGKAAAAIDDAAAGAGDVAAKDIQPDPGAPAKDDAEAKQDQGAGANADEAIVLPGQEPAGSTKK